MKITVGELRELIRERVRDTPNHDAIEITLSDVKSALEPIGRVRNREGVENVVCPFRVDRTFNPYTISDERADQFSRAGITPHDVLEAAKKGISSNGKAIASSTVNDQLALLLADSIRRSVTNIDFDAILSVESSSTLCGKIAEHLASMLGARVTWGHLAKRHGGLHKSPETMYADLSNYSGAHAEDIEAGIAAARDRMMRGGDVSHVRGHKKYDRKYSQGFHKLGDSRDVGLKNVLVVDDNMDVGTTLKDIKRELEGLGIKPTFAVGYDIKKQYNKK